MVALSLRRQLDGAMVCQQSFWSQISSSHCLRSTTFKEHSSFESAGFSGTGTTRMTIKRLAIKRTILPGIGLIIPLGKDL
jgi:hypothetical protein